MKRYKYYFIPARVHGHYNDYAQYFKKELHYTPVRRLKSKLKLAFFAKEILFDGFYSKADYLLYLLLISVRSLLFKKSKVLFIHTELLNFRGLRNSFVAITLLFLKKLPFVSTISILKGSSLEKIFNRFFDYHIYDPQLLDLAILNIAPMRPPGYRSDYGKPSILILGELNERKSRGELLNFLYENKNLPFKFVFGGKVPEKDLAFLEAHADCVVYNRYLKNAEFLFLLAKAGLVYVFYDKNINRSSGLFGRALQLQRHVLVRENSYLHRTFLNYAGLVPISSLSQLLDIELIKLLEKPIPKMVFEQNLFIH